MSNIKCRVCGDNIIIAWYERIMEESLEDAMLDVKPFERDKDEAITYPSAECGCTERKSLDRPTVSIKDVEEYVDTVFWKEWGDILFWLEEEEWG